VNHQKRRWMSFKKRTRLGNIERAKAKAKVKQEEEE
jgi:hypothetical protein